MKQRVQLVKKIHRIAELVEKQALAEVAAAEREAEAARQALVTLRRESAEAEARLLKERSLSGFAREMLWAHRAWFARTEQEAKEEIARREGLAEEARVAADAAKREARLRERVRERIVAEYRNEHERKANKDLDEVGARRFVRQDGG